MTTAIGGIGVSEWLPILAAWVGALAAWVGVWLGIRGIRLERRMYSLAIEAERRKEPAVEVYLVDSGILNPPGEERRIYVFQLLITNKSLSANSIKQIELALEYGPQGQPPSNVMIPHDSSAALAANMEATEVICVPCSIAARCHDCRRSTVPHRYRSDWGWSRGVTRCNGDGRSRPRR